MPRVTLAQIAVECGLAKSTVSYCLRNDPIIPLATRLRVQSMAREMGYEMDPSLAVLARYRWPDKARVSNATLGVIYYAGPHHLLKSLEGEASRLGYQVNYFDIRHYRSGKHLNKVLLSRGIQGLVVVAMPDIMKLDIDFSKFSIIHMGPESDDLHFHAVLPDLAKSIELATQKAVEFGYRRIGYALMDFKAAVTNYTYKVQATYERATLIDKLGPQPPLFIYDVEIPNPYPLFREWYDQYLPDVIIATMDHPWWYLTDALFFDQRRPPVKVPEEAGIIIVRNALKRDIMPSYVDIEYVLGPLTVQLLHEQMIRGEKGLPTNPTRILTSCKWMEGQTVRHQD